MKDIPAMPAESVSVCQPHLYISLLCNLWLAALLHFLDIEREEHLVGPGNDPSHSALVRLLLGAVYSSGVHMSILMVRSGERAAESTIMITVDDLMISPTAPKSQLRLKSTVYLQQIGLYYNPGKCILNLCPDCLQSCSASQNKTYFTYSYCVLLQQRCTSELYWLISLNSRAMNRIELQLPIHMFL